MVFISYNNNKLKIIFIHTLAADLLQLTVYNLLQILLLDYSLMLALLSSLFYHQLSH